MRAVLPAILGVLIVARARARTIHGPRAAVDRRRFSGPRPRAPQPRLRIAPCTRDDPAALADQLRYREQIEVRGKAMDARSLTLKLEWWMKDIELDRGATPAAMSAPSIAEMRDYRPHGGDALNLMPVMQWLAEKLGKKK